MSHRSEPVTTPDSNTLMKICTHCGKEKPATPEFFARQKIGKYGLRADCKECHYERERIRNANKPKGERPRKSSKVLRRAAMYRADPSLCDRPDVQKRCFKCKQDFPSTSEFFHRSAIERDGLSKACKQCTKAHHDEYYQRPEIKRRMKEYQQQPDVKQRMREYMKEYYQRPDVKHRVMEYQKEYQNRPETQRYQQEYRKQYYKRPEVRDRVRAKGNNRRAAPGSFTAADIREIRKAQGNRCYICGKKLKKFHVDHFIPIALGGTNDPGNLRLACPRCNLSKSAKHPHTLGILI